MMYELLVRIILIVALAQFGMTISDLSKCRTKECFKQIEHHSRDVLQIDWKPISVWPEETARFR